LRNNRTAGGIHFVNDKLVWNTVTWTENNVYINKAVKILDVGCVMGNGLVGRRYEGRKWSEMNLKLGEKRNTGGKEEVG